MQITTEDRHNKKKRSWRSKIQSHRVSSIDLVQTQMSVSFRLPSDAPLHRSLSMDDRDPYNSESNDENLLYLEYINATSSPAKVQARDGIYPVSNEETTTANQVRSVPPRNYVSPYLQKLPHSNFLHVKPPPSGSSTSNKRKSQRREFRPQTDVRRRRSASAARTRGELLDVAYQPSNLDHLDLSSFCSPSHLSFSRPTSAPTRTQSASSKKKPSKTSARLITFYRNGDREKSFHTKATSLNAVLQYATEKLRLPSAARRIFDSNGREIYRKEDLQNQNEFYISMGENFKDPFKTLQTQSEYSLNATWTMKGLQMDSNKPKSFTTKTVLSKRLDDQIKTNVNLTIFENGFGHDDDASHILIDTNLKENLDKFLEESTKKLELNSHARKVFNYRGDEIKSLKIFFESDENSMTTAEKTSIVGPLWLSKGERFRPTGAFGFLENRHDEFRSALKKLRKQFDEVQTVLKRRRKRAMIADEDAEDSSNDETEDETKPIEIKDKSLLSMKKNELKQLKEAIRHQMKEIEDSIDAYKTKMDEIENEKINEEGLGAKFAIEHIKEIKFEDKIVGRHPLILTIHENGTFRDSDPTIHLNLRNLPAKDAGKTSIEYLLDHLQKTLEVFSRQRPKRVFDLYGTEIKLLGQLKSKQHLFISFGDDYRPAFEPCLAIQLHQVDIYQVDDRHLVVKAFRPNEEIISANEKRSLRQIVANWKPVESLPIDEIRPINYQTDLDDDQRQAFDSKKIDEFLNSNNLFLQKEQKLICPELKIQQKLSFDSKSKKNEDKPGSKQLFNPQDLQTWFYNKHGCLFNKQFPSLALTVVPEQTVQLTWTPGKLGEKDRRAQQLDGFTVQLRAKQNELSDNQIWIFTTDGFIVSKAFQEHALTSLATIIPEEGGKITATGIRMRDDDPTNFFLAICPQCSIKSPFIHRQRWGIRQESTFTIGDWKYSKVENPLWHKMALTWPVDATGMMISDLQWPVEGALIPGVPPIKSLKSSQAPLAFVPIRLQILKNGERDQSKAISVVGPDISNLILEPKSSVNIYRRLRLPEPEKEQRTDRLLKRHADARQREMKLFLENCTNLCNLPFAARRLFDISGNELFDLTSIERDSYVYVTCGEQWIDPELTKAEQQRRLLLAQLSNDVRMIYFYCALRNPIEYAMSTEKGLAENSPLSLSRCSLNAKQRDRVKQGESIEQVVEHEEPVEVIATEPEPRTAHERAHKLMDLREKEKFRHPWETTSTKKSTNADTDDDDVVMGGNDDQTLNESFLQTTDTLLLSSKNTRKVPKTKAVAMQRFRWEPVDGYISCMDESHLVLGVREIEGKVIDVFLKRRNPDDIYQRWLFVPANSTFHQMEFQEQTQLDLTQPFLIVSKARPSMVLTVLLPASTGNETTEVPISCVGCSVTLQQRRDEEFGGAHQKWAYDEQLGFLFAFHTSLEDKEITAANRSNICTYTVNYEAISQPGYVVSILNTSDQAEDVPVCVACAQAMRGKYRLTKMNPEQKFTCVIGKRRDLKFHGPFHCLNHKVDLTRNEAENTLFQRQEQLEQLRQEASVRNIVRELAAAKPIQIIHLLAYRNGDGHTKAGQLLVGSSIVGLLDQATQRLNLTNAARRMYVIDGTAILTAEDLIQWITEYYKKRFLQLNKTTLLDKVELNTPLPPKNPDSQRRASLDNQSEKTTFSTKIRNRSPSKRHFQSLPKFADLQRAIKQNPLTKILDVDMSYLLKFPIEIWVSAGEPFVNPSEIDQRQNQRVIQREQRTTVEHDLEREKHILRLMKGRRLFTQSPGELVGQQNLEQPVVKQGHWTQTTDAEVFKTDDVNALRSSLEEIRISQQPESTRPISSATTERLSQYSKTKRVLIYLNGESKDTAVQCFGTTLDEIKANAKLKFNLMLPIIVLFDEQGQTLERFEQLTRDQFICVSTTKTFVSYSERQHEVDVKANWARTRNKYGDQATDIRVNTVHSSTSQSVDPFGPPVLTTNDPPVQQQIQRRTFSKPPIAPPSAHRRPALPQSVQLPTTIQEITSISNMTKDSLQNNDDDDVDVDDDDDDDDDETDSEIERITSLDQDDQHDGFTLKTNENKRQALSPLLKSESASPTLPTTEPTMKQSDSDQDEDDFIRMLKGK